MIKLLKNFCFLIFISMLLNSCTKPERENPFDPDVRLMALTNFNLTQSSVSPCQHTWMGNSTN